MTSYLSIIVIVLLHSSLVRVEGFSPKLGIRLKSPPSQLITNDFNPSVSFQQRTNHIFMSGITEDNSSDYHDATKVIRTITSKILHGRKPKLPPSPENTLILGGDVLVLFLYSFMDHLITYFADHGNAEESIVGIHATWLDHLHLPAEFLTATTQVPNLLHYSPALQSAGICAVTITTLWLISAYFNEAYSYENTIYNSERVVLVTGKSWLYTGAGLIAIALASDSMLCGCPIQNHVGHLTKCDADFIFDSIGSLLCWRYMMSKVLSM